MASGEGVSDSRMNLHRFENNEVTHNLEEVAPPLSYGRQGFPPRTGELSPVIKMIDISSQ
jgi:hypothetical protein